MAGTVGVAIIALFLTTPTLNLDDLGYVTQWPVTFTHPQFWKVLSTVFLNADLGVAEMRTYGLSRAIHILTIAVFGKSPLGAYLTIAAFHLGSGFIIFALLREISGDKLIAVFAAVAWAASPAVLPFFKSEHHFLYSVAAFYPVLWWVVLSAKDSRCLKHGHGRKLAGVLLLTAAGLMGEAAVIAVGAGVMATAWARRNPQLIYQGLAAAALLGAYVIHEKIFINDPARSQRIPLALFNPDYLQGALLHLVENGKAFLSYSYHAAEFAGRVGGINAFKTPLTAAVFLAVFAAAMRASVGTSPGGTDVNRRLAVVPLVICLASIALHIGVGAMSGLPLAARYSAMFYALLPIALIALAAAGMPRHRFPIRATAGAAAAAAIAISLGTLYRTEILVNQPNRAFIAQLQPGTAYVLRHAEWPATSPDGAVSGAYPGFISTYQYEAANPFRLAWTTRLYLQDIKGVTVGTRCHIEADGRVSIFFGSEARGAFPAEAVKGGGLTSFWSREFRWQSLDELCSKSPPRSGG